jgi:hypothetical protein
MKVVGIDEAGRGPIIGPMVMCGVLIEEGQEKELTALGVKDSKLLSESARERIYAVLKEKYKYHLVIISPIEIDSVVGIGKGKNLNWLEAEKAALIVNALKPEKVIIDCPSPNLKAYTEFITERLDHKQGRHVICEQRLRAMLKSRSSRRTSARTLALATWLTRGQRPSQSGSGTSILKSSATAGLRTRSSWRKSRESSTSLASSERRQRRLRSASLRLNAEDFI